MGRRGSRRPGNPMSHGSGSGRIDRAVTLREEKTRKRDQSSNQKSNDNKKKGVCVKARDMLRIEHLESCALWAAKVAKIPSLAAFFGRTLALSRETLGLPPNNALFQCQRCETILRRDINCTVRSKKSKANLTGLSNYVVYDCDFCSHLNLKKENTRWLDKEVHPSNSETVMNEALSRMNSVGFVASEDLDAKAMPQMPVVSSEIIIADATEQDSSELVGEKKGVEEKRGSDLPSSEIINQTANNFAKHSVTIQDVISKQNFLDLDSPKPLELEEADDSIDEANELDKPLVFAEIDRANGLAMPTSTPTLTLLDTNKRKRKKPRAKKPAGPENSSVGMGEENTTGKSSKRKRKSWIGLKEIADASDQANKRNFYNLPILISL